LANFRHFRKLARPLHCIWQASPKAKPTGKTTDMKPTSAIQHEAKGTKLGATISLALLIAFGLSSYVNQQDKDINHAAAEHSNRPTVISAYLA
jgi:hypothetical protein